MNQLNGATRCWDIKRLITITKPDISEDERRNAMGGAGTQFFWGIDEKGRRYSLLLQDIGGNLYLVGVDDSRNVHKFLFSPHAIVKEIRKRSIR